jgi:plasmid stability protein
MRSQATKMQAEEPVQYTIRGVPPEVDRALRKKAAQLKRSLNQIVVDELTRATIGRSRKTDFSDLVGRWTPDPGFDEVIASQRQIDWDKWK